MPRAVTLVSLCASAQLAAAAPTLQTVHGPVVGAQVQPEVEAFLGVPFAAPPVGELRWRAPVDPTPWAAPRQATSFGSQCVQMGKVVDPATGEATSAAVGAEDCLTLNVWRPSAPSEPQRPVMFWIHGGANTAGSASEADFDGAAMAAAEDVIVVTTQYRLNTLGYLYYGPLQGADPLSDSGNFGILDQQKALRWVQRNAQALGADPDRVMIFGESAGGYNVWTQQMSPLADGLFSAAAVQSGCPAWVSQPAATAQGQRIAEAQVIADGLATEQTAAAFIEGKGATWTREYLYGKSAAALLEAVDAQGLITFNFNALEDGRVVPEGAITRFMGGDYTGVPTLVGANRDESKALFGALYPIGPVGYNKLTGALFGDAMADIEALYPVRDYLGPDLSYERLVDVADGYFELVCSMEAGLVASAHHEVWLYRFDYDRLLAPDDAAYGAYHTAEIPFVFGTHQDADYAPGTEAERAALTQAMRGAWTCLARTGSPDACAGTRPWPRLDQGSRLRQTFDVTSEVAPIPAKELEKIDYWVQWGGFGEPGARKAYSPHLMLTDLF